MPNIRNFDDYSLLYDAWVEHHPYIFQEELRILKKFVPPSGKGIEIGVGTGRMAAALNIEYGIDAAESMCQLAQKRGINVFKAYAESLPFPDDYFDFVLISETLCLITSPLEALKEAKRILKPSGLFILGLINWNQVLSRSYLVDKVLAQFYRSAHFYTVNDIHNYFKQIHLKLESIYPIFFTKIEALNFIGKIEENSNEGGFVVITGRK